MDMVRHGTENAADRRPAAALDARPAGACASRANCPSASRPNLQLDLHGAADGHQGLGLRIGVHAREPFAQGASEDAQAFATSLMQPYCGVNSGFEAVSWLAEPQAAESIALLPLRAGARRAGLRAAGAGARPTRSASRPRWAPTS